MTESQASNHHVVVELRFSRRFVFGLLALLVLGAGLFWGTTALARVGAVTPASSPALTASTVVSYQGKVSVGATPYNGTGYFKFTVVNDQGTAAYWANDGTGLATAPFTPTSAVALSVNNGLFNVLLGDTSHANMTQPLKPAVFSAPDRMLRVWFSDGVNDFQQLSPDTTVASAPYALSAEFARTTPNLERIALLKWYTAISTTQSNFGVGQNPSAVAFDGIYVWVANQGSDSVWELRASDGNPTLGWTVGSGPSGLAFDGANMWVTNYYSDSVSVLNARYGLPNTVMTPAVGSGPYGVAFDGANMWVANSGSNSVSVLRASDGSHVMTLTVGSGPLGVAFDGANMWVTNNGSNSVSVLRASDGYHVMTPTVGSSPIGVAFDGANIWVTNSGSDSVSVLRASDGSHVMTPTVGLNPFGVAFDGANMWVTNQSSGSVSVLRASDGALVETATVGSGPRGVAFDGANMWVTNSNSGSVSKR